MTPEHLAEIKARVEAATPGMWKVNIDIRDAHVTMGVENSYIDAPKKRLAYVWDTDTREGKANAAFIAHARQDVPALVAEVERLQDENNQLRYAARMSVRAFRLSNPRSQKEVSLQLTAMHRLEDALKEGEE